MATLSRIVIASHNEGKVREIRELLAPLHIDVTSAATLNLPEPEETGATFIANAELKAHSAASLSGLPSLADDSGLAIPALDGAPGIYSARWAGPDKDFSLAMQRIRDELQARGKDINGCGAYFVCVLALALPGGECHHFEGRVDGTLVYPPRGTQGFGYDPIFVPEGYDMTFGEMEPGAKHLISHRARAFDAFMAHMKSLSLLAT